MGQKGSEWLERLMFRLSSSCLLRESTVTSPPSQSLTLTFVGGGKTNEEIKQAERRKKWHSRLGLTLLIVGSFVQVLRLVGVLG